MIDETTRHEILSTIYERVLWNKMNAEEQAGFRIFAEQAVKLVVEVAPEFIRHVCVHSLAKAASASAIN